MRRIFLYIAFLFCFITAFSQKILISEVFYDTPLYENDKDSIPSTHNGEFIELYNPYDNLEVDLYGWYLKTDKHVYSFPKGAKIGPEDYLLICYEDSVAPFTIKDIFTDIQFDERRLLRQHKLIIRNTREELRLMNPERICVSSLRLGYEITKGAHNGEKSDWSNLYSVQRNSTGFFCGKASPGIITAGNIPVDDDLFLAYPYSADYKVINTGLQVGSIPGEAGISGSGAATYVIPVDVLPGIMNIQPSVSIQYNSQAGISIMGKGWSIGGLSEITRAVLPAYTGRISGVSGVTTSGFFLDGVRLIDMGANKFKTESNPLSDIYYDKAGNTFTVKCENGTVMSYGGANGSSVIPDRGSERTYVYRLNTVTDIHGNYMEYIYASSASGKGENVISEIRYTGNKKTGQPCFYALTFNYTRDANKQRTENVNGTSFYLNKLLNSIDIRDISSGTILFSYEFMYISDLYETPLLNCIRKKNTRGEKLNETVIDWKRKSPVSETSVLDIKDSYEKSFSARKWTTADFDRDGLTDLICFFPYTSPAGFQMNKTIVYYASRGETGKVEFDRKQEIDMQSDMNPGDGSFLKVGAPSVPVLGPGGNPLLVYPVIQGKERDITAVTLSIVPRQGRGNLVELPLTDKSMPVYAYADLNNDGIDEFFYIQESGKGKIVAFPELGNPKFTDFSISTYHLGIPRKVFIADFNRDGLKDIALITDNGMFFYINDGGSKDNTAGVIVSRFRLCELKADFYPDFDFIEMGDFNGDGLPDFIYNRTESENWFLALNQGIWNFDMKEIPASVLPARKESAVYLPYSEEEIIVQDFDGDGKDDLIIFDVKFPPTGSPGSPPPYGVRDAQWLLSYGTGFRSIRSVLLSRYPLNVNVIKSPALTGDFDGDGYPEFIYYGRDCRSNGSDKWSSAVKWRRYSIDRDIYRNGLVSAISNGFNQKTFFDYTLLSGRNNELYTSGMYNSWPVVEMVPTFACLKDITVCNELEEPQTVTFRYSGFKIHARGRGMLGFEKITSFNETDRTGREQRVRYRNDGLPEYTETTVFSDVTPVSTERTDYSYVEKAPGLRLSMIASVGKEDFLKGVSEKTVMEYDTVSGHLLKQETEYGNGALLTYTYGNYVRGIPCTVNCIKKHPDDDSVNTTVMEKTFDGDGNLILQVNDPGTDKEVVTRYKNYTAQGLPCRKETETATNSPSDENILLWEEYTYDPTGRFLLASTDFLGVTRYVYDRQRGLMTAKTTSGNLTERFAYDNWGNMIEMIDTLGIKTSITVRWALKESPTSVYKITTESPGRPPLTVWYDARNRGVLEETAGQNYMSLRSEYTYNEKGELTDIKRFQENEKMLHIQYGYDGFGRKVRELHSTGREIAYNYSSGSVATVINGTTYRKEYDGQGLLVRSSDPGGTVVFGYSSVGKPSRITAPNSDVTLDYDKAGNRIKITTAGLGSWNYRYDGLGNLIRQTDPQGNEMTVFYDTHGRKVSQKLNDRLYLSCLYVTSGSGKGRLFKVVHEQNGSFVTYYYNGLNQLSGEARRMPSGEIMTYAYVYDENGRLLRKVFPGSVIVDYEYDDYGFLSSVTQDNISFWRSYSVTPRMKLYGLAGGVTVTNRYDSYGFLQDVQAKKAGSRIPFQKYRYDIDPATGLLEGRTLNNCSERFTYDDLRRLTSVDLYAGGSYMDTYLTQYSENLMDYKTGAGNYVYDASKLTQIVPDSRTHDRLLTGEDSIAYTAFGKVSSICSENVCYDFTYGTDGQRISMDLKEGGRIVKTVLYGSDYEKETDSIGRVRHLYYIRAGAELVGVLIKEGSAPLKAYAVHTDHQGSILALSDENGNLVESYSYDPWGRRRDPLHPESDPVPETVYLTRGYTGHEHLDRCALINMNGRIYDPLLARFLSVDNFVTAPEGTQHYNRYGYVGYNPMSYTDPQGEFDVLVGVFAVIGTYVGGVIGNDFEFNPGKWDFRKAQTWTGMGFGAFSGALAGSMGLGGISLSFQIRDWVAVSLDISLKYGKMSLETLGWMTAGGGGLFLGWEIYKVKQGIHPDKDRRLTFTEAKAWYLYGNGEPLIVDINSIDFSKVKRSDFDAKGYYKINLTDPREPGMWSTASDGLVYGQLDLWLTDNGNSFKIDPNVYDFDFKDDGASMRNILTFIGKYWNENIFLTYPNTGILPLPIYHRRGTPYEIIFDGTYKFK